MPGSPRALAACSTRSFLSASPLPALDRGLQPRSGLSLPLRLCSVRGCPAPLLFPRPPRRPASPAPFLWPLTHRSRNRDLPCFPGSPVLGKLLPPRTAPRVGRGGSELGSGRWVGWICCPAFLPAPRVVLRAGAGFPRADPRRPCRACSERPGTQRSCGFKSWRAEQTPRTSLAQPLHLPALWYR